MNCHKMMCASLCGFLFGLSGFAEKDVPLSANALLPEGFDTSAAKTSNAISSMMAHRKILSSEGLALKDNIKVEYGEGHGETIDEALKEAMKDVLQKVVGVYVDSDFRMNNDEIIKDEIITHSNGFIDHYKKIEVADDADGRGKTVTIRAWVKMRDFVNRIKKITPSQTVEMDGAVIANDLSNTVNAEILLKKELGSLDPAIDLLDVNLVKGVRPVVINTTDEAATLRYVFEVRYSKTKYEKKFIPRLVNVLDQIAEKTPNEQSVVLKVQEAKLYPAIYDPHGRDSYYKSWKECPVTGQYLVSSVHDSSRDSVRIVTSSSKGNMIKIREWKLSEWHYSIYNNLIANCRKRAAKTRCNFSLIDARGSVLAQSTCKLAKNWFLEDLYYELDGRVPISFAPFFHAWSWVDTALIKYEDRWKTGDCERNMYDRYVGCIDIAIDRKDVAKIKAAKVSLETNNEGENK